MEHVRGAGEPEIARIASAQKGLVTRQQLLAAGFGRGAINHRLRQRRIRSYHPGVYLVGHDGQLPLAAEMAAVLYYRGHALLSDRSAAAVWGFAPNPAEVTLTVVGTDRRSLSGVRVSRVATLDRRDLRAREGLPVTAPARTLLDLAAHASPAELEQALAEARVRGLVRNHELTAAIARAPRRRGGGVIRRLLGSEAGPALTRSDAEQRLLGLLRQAQLPIPACNARLHGNEVDFLWREQRLVLEVDGFAFHGSRAAFERDRKRDMTLVAAGYRVIRVTWRQIVEEPLAVVARIAQALQSAPA